MNVHDRLHSIMTSVILYCQCVQVLPLSPRQPGVTKVLPLSLLAVLGWAGLGWAEQAADVKRCIHSETVL